ncbi:uncharacterized protein LOC111626774 [Centruroides sculpturatus]|uniref:uncharacterized protein LOC111626774 n=1 Tax=Centruroides sculpturatus TaxID=218467 RepID=UPI000C6D6115|nr:uncharacterized protein LOC111626774 [Centruroides sculpturatus]
MLSVTFVLQAIARPVTIDPVTIDHTGKNAEEYPQKKKKRKETDISNKKTQEFSEELENTMFHLHQIITATAEPIQQCLPSFILLYKIWLNMQDEITYLNILSTLANNIFRCVENSHKLVNDEKLEYLIENFEKVHEVKTFPQTEDISDSISASKNTVIYFPVSISNFSKMQLQFGVSKIDIGVGIGILNMNK